LGLNIRRSSLVLCDVDVVQPLRILLISRASTWWWSFDALHKVLSTASIPATDMSCACVCVLVRTCAAGQMQGQTSNPSSHRSITSARRTSQVCMHAGKTWKRNSMSEHSARKDDRLCTQVYIRQVAREYIHIRQVYTVTSCPGKTQQRTRRTYCIGRGSVRHQGARKCKIRLFCGEKQMCDDIVVAVYTVFGRGVCGRPCSCFGGGGW
jgi:hypothetical protein